MIEAVTNGRDFHELNLQVIEKFRETGGAGGLGPVRFDRLVLLTTTGRRTGQQRTLPLGSAPDAARTLSRT